MHLSEPSALTPASTAPPEIVAPDALAPDALAPDVAPQPGASLSGRMVSGVSWNLVGALGGQVLTIARTVCLTRLLSQGDFGIAGMASTVIAALYTLSNTGIVGSIISSHFDSEAECGRYMSSIWTLEIIRGALIALVLALVAAPMARFYGEAKLLPVFLVLALTPIFTSLSNLGLGLQVRDLQFKSTMLHSLVSNFAGVAFTVLLAWWTRNYWALVWGQIAGAAVGTALSYAFSNYRPRLTWNAAHARRAFDFGKHLFVIGLANYAITTADNVLVGKLLGATVLGSYIVAYSFCNLPRTLISNVLGAILFPAFAIVGRQNDAPRLNLVVSRAFALTCAILSFVIPPLIAFAPAIVRVLYGPQWEGSIAPLRVLLVAGYFSAVLAPLSTLAVSLDRPKLESGAKIFDAVVFLALLYPLILWQGTVGAALAGCLSYVIAVGVRWIGMSRLAPQGFAPLPWLVISSLICGAVAAALGAGMGALSFGGAAGLDWTRLASALWSSRMPDLPAAWSQLLIGLPLVGLLSGALFSVLHPLAGREIAGAFGKLRASRGK